MCWRRRFRRLHFSMIETRWRAPWRDSRTIILLSTWWRGIAIIFQPSWWWFIAAPASVRFTHRRFTTMTWRCIWANFPLPFATIFYISSWWRFIATSTSIWQSCWRLGSTLLSCIWAIVPPSPTWWRCISIFVYLSRWWFVPASASIRSAQRRSISTKWRCISATVPLLPTWWWYIVNFVFPSGQGFVATSTVWSPRWRFSLTLWGCVGTLASLSSTWWWGLAVFIRFSKWWSITTATFTLSSNWTRVSTSLTFPVMIGTSTTCSFICFSCINVTFLRVRSERFPHATFVIVLSCNQLRRSVINYSNYLRSIFAHIEFFDDIIVCIAQHRQIHIVIDNFDAANATGKGGKIISK